MHSSQCSLHNDTFLLLPSWCIFPTPLFDNHHSAIPPPNTTFLPPLSCPRHLDATFSLPPSMHHHPAIPTLPSCHQDYTVPMPLAIYMPMLRQAVMMRPSRHCHPAVLILPSHYSEITVLMLPSYHPDTTVLTLLSSWCCPIIFVPPLPWQHCWFSHAATPTMPPLLWQHCKLLSMAVKLNSKLIL